VAEEDREWLGALLLRPARPDEGRAVAELWLTARKASFPANPAGVHDDEDVRHYFATVVLAHCEVVVAEHPAEGLVGLLVLATGFIEHLMVAPGRDGRGLGSMLVGLAKARSPAGLDLWTFQSNGRARSFYERHGFVAVASTDGDNEEGAPDVRYHWPPPTAQAAEQPPDG